MASWLRKLHPLLFGMAAPIVAPTPRRKYSECCRRQQRELISGEVLIEADGRAGRARRAAAHVAAPAVRVSHERVRLTSRRPR